MAGRRRTTTPAADAEAAPLDAPTGANAAPDASAPAAPADDAAAPLNAPAPEPADAAPLDLAEAVEEPETPGEVQETPAAPLDPPPGPVAPSIDLPPIPDAPPPPPASLNERPGLDLRHHDGTPVDPDDLFEDPGLHFTFLVVRHRVFERHYYDGATETADRLLFTPGYRLARHEAARVLADLQVFQQNQ